MSRVTNQYSFIELTPLPVPKEKSYDIRRAVAKVALAIIITGFFGYVGALCSLIEFPFTVIRGIQVGSLIGVIATLALLHFLPTPSEINQYRVDTLEQIASEQTDSLVSSSLNRLIFQFKSFSDHLENIDQLYSLHRDFSVVTDAVSKQRRVIQGIWEAFLQHLHKAKIGNFDGQVIHFDFSKEQEHLKGKQLLAGPAHFLSRWSLFSKRDFRQIEEIQKIAFGTKDTTTSKELKNLLSKKSSNSCVVVRNKSGKEILGFGWVFKEKDHTEIGGIARRADAPFLNIGNELMYALLNAQKQGEIVQLKVRKSNKQAIHLFEKWGFVKIRDLPKHFQSHPKNGILMQLDWERFNRLINCNGPLDVIK